MFLPSIWPLAYSLEACRAKRELQSALSSAMNSALTIELFVAASFYYVALPPCYSPQPTTFQARAV